MSVSDFFQNNLQIYKIKINYTPTYCIVVEKFR